ncbi:MAG: T9SS type A sorting domain-containing protein, partial [Candidatus Zixiibacteriota bacterium]
GQYAFVGLPAGDYCVFRDQASFQYCFFPLESDTCNINFSGLTQVGGFLEQNTTDCLQLFPNYPNPFNPVTNIAYYLPGDARVKLTIYNLRGEKVCELVNKFQNRGWKEVPWDGKNSQGKKVASGVYFCKLQTSERSEIIRMVLLK